MSGANAVVVGGGLAGLVAATSLARGGVSVTLLERGRRAGGRARTHEEAGWALNLGPHALYRASTGVPILRSLGVEPVGKVAPAAGWLRSKGELHPLPATPWAIATSPLFPGRSRMEALAWFASLPFPRASYAGRTVAEVLAGLSEPVQRVARYLVRLTTYVEAPELLDAGVAFRQVARGLRGVYYLDGGWGALVAQLEERAVAAGVTIRTGVDVQAADADGVRTAEGERLAADAVVLAVPPATARRLGASVPDLMAVRAACLDLGLARLPVPDRRAVFDLDEPLYFSNHASVARVAPEGAATVHALRYLRPGEDAGGAVAGLEGWLDAVQPGWRAEVRVRREAAALTVAWALDGVGVQRPGILSPEGIWLAGDWVEAEGMLADAAIESGMAVAAAVRGRLRKAA